MSARKTIADRRRYLKMRIAALELKLEEEEGALKELRRTCPHPESIDDNGWQVCVDCGSYHRFGSESDPLTVHRTQEKE